MQHSPQQLYTMKGIRNSCRYEADGASTTLTSQSAITMLILMLQHTDGNLAEGKAAFCAARHLMGGSGTLPACRRRRSRGKHHQVKCDKLIPAVVQVNGNKGLCGINALFQHHKSAHQEINLQHQPALPQA